jgi:hypothetical protein
LGAKMKMMDNDFRISIINQGWISPEDDKKDICSHGSIRLIIGGTEISSGDTNYGISQSALALLRTLKTNHVNTHRVCDRLILHGCSLLLMMSCPIGIDWDVEYFNNEVIINNVRKYDTTSENNHKRYDIEVRLSIRKYREQVIDFAKKAKEIFVVSPRLLDNKDDIRQHIIFWSEYDNLLNEFS